MKSTHTDAMMICPCCGIECPSPTEVCSSCQARPVDQPLVQPETTLPGLGPTFAAWALVGLVVVGFLAFWLLANDMKVARVLLVSALGESTKLTQTLLQFDPSLLQYRIFTFDAYRLACTLSVVLIPVSFWGFWLSRRARRLALTQPSQFGGRRLATAALALSAVLFVVFSAAGISWVPRAIQNGRAKHIASVRAEFYRLHNEALNQYYAEFGTYPQELSDLRDAMPAVIPAADYWGNPIQYAPTALIASKNSAPGYSNYQLVSAGPDGVLETADDIRMIDGVIVSALDNGDWLSSIFPKLSSEPR